MTDLLTTRDGPWHIGEPDNYDAVIYDKDGFEVARVCYPNRDANAALIAKAPCLVAALFVQQNGRVHNLLADLTHALKAEGNR